MEEPRVYHANMSIHGLDTSIGAWDEELGVDELLYGKNDTVLDSEADCGA